MRKLVRLANAAEYLGVRTPTLRAWYLKRKNLDFVKAGRAVCVTEESIERFIAENLRSRVTLSHPIEQQALEGGNSNADPARYRACRTQRSAAVLAFSERP